MPDLLLVDDNRTTQRVFELSLAQEGVTVHCFESGSEALDYLQNGSVDLVFLSVSQREGDGYELCRRVKRCPQAKLAPVVMMVGAFQTFDEERAKKARCRAHLPKPFETSRLLAMVRDLLANPDEEPLSDLPPGTLFEVPARGVASQPVFDLPAEGTRPSAFALERDIVLPKLPRFEASAQAPTAAKAARKKEPLSDEDVQRIADRLTDKLPNELSRLLPDLIRRTAAGDD